MKDSSQVSDVVFRIDLCGNLNRDHSISPRETV
jgi:hypothetical protein